jgi:hypothetical protein
VNSCSGHHRRRGPSDVGHVDARRGKGNADAAGSRQQSAGRHVQCARAVCVARRERISLLTVHEYRGGRLGVRGRDGVVGATAGIGARRLAGNDVLLSNGGSGSIFSGFVPLAGVARDTVLLVVTARDVSGAATEVVQKFVHDRMPVITIASPVEGDVARPAITISASCGDDDPAGCRSLVVTSAGQTLLTGTLSTLTDLSTASSTPSFQVSGGYAVFVRGDYVYGDLYRRDLSMVTSRTRITRLSSIISARASRRHSLTSPAAQAASPRRTG